MKYYKDPLKAAYMAREHKVNITAEFYDRELDIYIRRHEYNGDWFNVIADFRSMRCMNGYARPDRYGVHPDSEHIFDLITGDTMADSMSREIIRRDNKAFFMPEARDE